jgi:hypothetical protein
MQRHPGRVNRVLVPLLVAALGASAAVPAAAYDRARAPRMPRAAERGRPAPAPASARAASAEPAEAHHVVSNDDGSTLLIASEFAEGRGLRLLLHKLDRDGRPLWDPAGVVVTGPSAVAYSRAIASDGAGGAIVVWEDARGVPSRFVVLAQRVDSQGRLQWPQDGVALCTASERQFDPRVIPDGAGGAIVLWEDERDGPEPRPFLQRLGRSAAILWDPAGVPVALNGTSLGDRLVSDGQGGAIACWVQFDPSVGEFPEVRAQRFGPDGSPLWTPGSVLVGIDPTISGPVALDAIEDGPGGTIVAWSQPGEVRAQRVDSGGTLRWVAGGAPVLAIRDDAFDDEVIAVTDGAGGAIVIGTAISGNKVLAGRVDSDGQRLWPEAGVPVTKVPGLSPLVLAAPDGAGGVWVARSIDWSWEYRREPPGCLWLHRLDADGREAWPGGPIDVCPRGAMGWPSALHACDGGDVVATWSATCVSEVYSDLFAQRVTPEGAERWAPGGVRLSSGLRRERRPASAQSGGDLVVAWQEPRGGDFDVVARRFRPTGIPAGPPIVVCGSAGSQTAPAIDADGAGGAIVAWLDGRRCDADVYAQRLGADGRPMWQADGVPVTTRDGAQQGLAVGGDGAGGAVLTWSDLDLAGAVVRVQRLSADGSPRWANGGIGLGLTDQSLRFSSSVPDDAGGTFVVWPQWDGGWPLAQRLTRLDAGGSTRWEVDAGVASEAGFYPYQPPAPRVVADGSGGVILCDAHAHPQRVGPDGQGLWPPDSALPEAATAIAPDGTGGAFFAWATMLDGLDLYAQHLDAAGNPLWRLPGAPALTNPGDQYASGIVPSPGGGALVVSQDCSSDLYGRPVGTRISSQPLRADGRPGSGSWQGIEACTTAVRKLSLDVAPDGAGGAYLTWEEPDWGAPGRVRVQHLDASGLPLWAADGVWVNLLWIERTERHLGRTILEARATDPTLAVTVLRRTESSSWTAIGSATPEPDGAIRFEDAAATEGERYAYRIVAQAGGGEQSSEEVWVDPMARPALAIAAAPLLSGAGDLAVSVALPLAAPARLEALDVAGRRVGDWPLAGYEPGAHLLTLPGSDALRPGVYLFRLSQGGHAVVRRAVVVR